MQKLISKYTLITLILIIFFSCSNQNKSESVINIEDEKEIYFIKNDEIEKLIDKNETLFLSYWIGMTKKEAIEVTRYLLDNKTITGIVYDPNDDSTSMKYCSDFCLDALGKNNCSYVEFNPKNNKLLWQDNAQSFRILLEHTLFEIKLNYSEMDGVNTLSSIFLEAVAEVTTCYGVSYNEFEGIVKLFNEKYGTPESCYFKSPNKGSCSYRFGNKEIELYYQSSKPSEKFQDFNAPNQIHILYFDKIRKQEEIEYRNNKIKNQKEKHDEERKKLDEQSHFESLKKI